MYVYVHMWVCDSHSTCMPCHLAPSSWLHHWSLSINYEQGLSPIVSHWSMPHHVLALLCEQHFASWVIKHLLKWDWLSHLPLFAQGAGIRYSLLHRDEGQIHCALQGMRGHCMYVHTYIRAYVRIGFVYSHGSWHCIQLQCVFATWHLHYALNSIWYLHVCVCGRKDLHACPWPCPQHAHADITCSTCVGHDSRVLSSAVLPPTPFECVCMCVCAQVPPHNVL